MTESEEHVAMVTYGVSEIFCSQPFCEMRKILQNFIKIAKLACYIEAGPHELRIYLNFANFSKVCAFFAELMLNFFIRGSIPKDGRQCLLDP